MATPNYAQLVKQLANENVQIQQSAKQSIMALDEDAIVPLIDEFYAGVTDKQGVAILAIIAEIGGPDAMSTLRSVFHLEETRPVLQHAAALGLLHNSQSLSPHEIDELETYKANDGQS